MVSLIQRGVECVFIFLGEFEIEQFTVLFDTSSTGCLGDDSYIGVIN